MNLRYKISAIISISFLLLCYQNCGNSFTSNFSEDFSSSIDSGELEVIPEEPEVEEPETPEPEEPKPEVSGGTYIQNHEWKLNHTYFVSFGDHSADKGFVPSQPGDKDTTKVTVKKGSHYGSGLYYVFPAKTQEAWASLCIRFSENWTASVGGKLPGFSGDSSPANGGQGGNASTGNNAWSARMLYGIFDTKTNSVPLGLYVYHSAYASQSIYGDAEWWAPAPGRYFSQAARVKQSRWDSIKQHVVMNSPGKSDGILEGWHNGKLVYQRKNFNFTNNEKFREVQKFWLDIYYGGGATPPTDHDVYFDQINYSLGSVDKTSVNCTN